MPSEKCAANEMCVTLPLDSSICRNNVNRKSAKSSQSIYIYIYIYWPARVEATSCLIHNHFPHLLPLLKFSSKFVEDLQEVLSSGSDFAFVFRGTNPAAYGLTFGSQTDINLRRGIGIPNMCRLYQDLLVYIYKSECFDFFRQWHLPPHPAQHALRQRCRCTLCWRIKMVR
jgi:hypothetical protein